MIRILLISILVTLFTADLYSQPRFQSIGKVETNLIKNNDNSYSLFVSFRIAFDDLIFAKDDSGYSSGAEFYCEVYDGDKLVERKSVTETVKTASYQGTLNENSYIQTILQFQLYKSTFVIKPSFTRTNTNIEYPFKEVTLDLINNPKIVRPIIISAAGNEQEFLLVNHNNSIPFDGDRYSLLIPVPDSITSAEIKFQQKSADIKDTTLTLFTKSVVTIGKSDSSLYVKTGSKEQNTFAYVKLDLPAVLSEGDLTIILEYNKKKTIYNLPVIWFDKPFILNDIDLSIRLLRIITDSKSVDLLESQPSDKKYELLKQEWNRITKMKPAGLNPLMKEFYTRADYAMKSFSFNGQRNGAESDRGKVYLQFGRPTKIEREYNEKNEITELWYYENLKREFIFEDTTGKGNYSLRK